MSFARSLLALAALCAAAACADGASRITAPSAASRDGGWVGSDNVVAQGGSTATTTTADGGTWIGSGNATPPADSSGNGRSGTWIGSGN